MVYKSFRKTIALLLTIAILFQNNVWADSLLYKRANVRNAPNTLQVRSFFRSPENNLLAAPILIERFIEQNPKTSKKALTTVEIAAILNMCDQWKAVKGLNCSWVIADDLGQMEIKVENKDHILQMRYFFSHEKTRSILPENWENVEVERLNRYLCKQIRLLKKKKEEPLEKRTSKVRAPEITETTDERGLAAEQVQRQNRAEKQNKGSSAEPHKIASGAIIGVTGFVLFTSLAVFFGDYSFFAGVVSYAIVTGLLPLLTALYMEKAIFLPEYNKRYRGEKRTANYQLIKAFKKSDNIEDLIEYDEDAKGKISYYSYNLEKLYVDHLVMKRVPKLFQYIIYLHESIHGKLRVKTEVVAVTLTFCIPAFFLFLVMALNVFMQQGISLKVLYGVFLAFNTGMPFFAKILSHWFGVEKTQAGHYLLSRKKTNPLTSIEIDDHIVSYVKDKTMDGQTGKSMYWRAWLKGEDDDGKIHFIESYEKAEDIVLVRLGEDQDSIGEDIRGAIKGSLKKRIVLIIADDGQNKGRVHKIANIAKKAAAEIKGKKLVRIDVRSTKYNLSRLKELEKFYKRRLARIKEGKVLKEAISAEVHGHSEKLEKALKWLQANNYKELVLMGDYLAKKGPVFNTMDILRLHKLSMAFPALKMLMGRSEHVFLRVMLGDPQFSALWPDMPTMEGTNIIEELLQLANRPITAQMLDMQREDILKAKKFNDILKRQIRKEGKPVTEQTLRQKMKENYRFHPKLIELSEFMIEYMFFCFYENKGHNIFMIGSIPNHFQWKGLKGVGALRAIEKEFRERSLSHLRMLKVLKQLWIEINSADQCADKTKWLNDFEDIVTNIIQKEREKSDRTGMELISEKQFDDLQEDIREVIRKASNQWEDEPEKAFEQAIEKLNVLTSQIKEPLPEVFDLVIEPKGTPFIIEKEGGIETASNTYMERDKERDILGVNAVVTPSSFLSEGFQSLEQLIILDSHGCIRLLDVDSLDGFRAKEKKLILAAERSHEIKKGASLQSVTLRKLKDVKAILRNYQYSGINVPSSKKTSIGRITGFFLLMRYYKKRILERLIDKTKKEESQKYILEGSRMLAHGDAAGAIFLQQVIISERSSKQQKKRALDILLRYLSPEYSEDIKGGVSEILSALVVVGLEDMKQAKNVFVNIMDNVYPWVEAMGRTKQEIAYKTEIMKPLIDAVKLNKKFRKVIIAYAKKRKNKDKIWFIAELLEGAHLDSDILKGASDKKSKRTKKDNKDLFDGEYKYMLEQLVQVLARLASNCSLTGTGKEKTKIVLALDSELSDSENVNELIMDNVIRPLRNMGIANDVLRGIFEKIEIIHGNALSIEQALDYKIEKGITKIDEVIIVTSERNRASFKKRTQQNAYITSLDIKGVAKGQTAYVPVLETVLFSLLRLLSINRKDLLKSYLQISGSKSLSMKKLVNMCFDSGKVKKTVILEILPDPEKQEKEIEESFLNLRKLIYSV